ncbi:MAG TPA: FIST C-terminal domain-containing protein [Polyangiaceae bacterium]|jgi:small ligand-binding sensory domain FIST|nr:FIST C-terminal domain-containing protein [Polyangiaceae bacterium]
MARRAQSFEVRSSNPERVLAGFLAAFEEVPRCSAGIVFLCGALLERHEALARLLAAKGLGVPLLLVGGTGVLSERGEIEGAAAATGLVWSGGSAAIGIIDSNNDDDGLSEGLQGFLADAGERATCVLFVPPGGFTPRAIQRLGRCAIGTRVFGGGAVGAPGVIAVGADGEVVTGRAVAMSFRGLGQARIRTTHSCRLLGPLRPITKARGSLVLELGSEPALDVLTQFGHNLKGQPLVFTVLAQSASNHDSPDGRPEILVRGVQGIDPHARGLIVSDEVREGMFMTFGIRDGQAARDDLERLTRELRRDIAGAAPLSALYVNCGGRGRSLYGRSNVDTRILRERFGEIPVAGMQSSFEIAPYGDSPSFQLYTGVVALFSELS